MRGKRWWVNVGLLGAMLSTLVGASLSGTPAGAQAKPPVQAPAAQSRDLAGNSLAGDWQVLFNGSYGPRMLFRITKGGQGWRALAYYVDQPYGPASIPSIAVTGEVVSFSATSLNGNFEGKLSADRSTIAGKWTQDNDGKNGFVTQPITLARATEANAWPLPASPAPVIMAANLDPTFEVTTVKPHDPSARGTGWAWKGARRFEATMTVADLLADVYGLNRRQLVNAPDWATKDVYDFVGVPDLPGWPTIAQRYSLERKLLETRFGLKVHTAKREMAALTLTAPKGAAKLSASVIVDPGVTVDFRPGPSGGVLIAARNCSMGDFLRFLERALDKPVVDRTGLPGQFDYDLTFTPDDSIYGGNVHMPPNDGPPPPVLFTAMSEQLGLKLVPSKGPVEVLVIDHLERPTPN